MKRAVSSIRVVLLVAIAVWLPLTCLDGLAAHAHGDAGRPATASHDAGLIDPSAHPVHTDRVPVANPDCDHELAWAASGDNARRFAPDMAGPPPGADQAPAVLASPLVRVARSFSESPPLDFLHAVVLRV